MAERLGLTLAEFDARVSVEELWLWWAHLELTHEEREKALKQGR